MEPNDFSADPAFRKTLDLCIESKSMIAISLQGGKIFDGVPLGYLDKDLGDGDSITYCEVYVLNPPEDLIVRDEHYFFFSTEDIKEVSFSSEQKGFNYSRYAGTI